MFPSVKIFSNRTRSCQIGLCTYRRNPLASLGLVHAHFDGFGGLIHGSAYALA